MLQQHVASATGVERILFMKRFRAMVTTASKDDTPHVDNIINESEVYTVRAAGRCRRCACHR
jgi:hypothetical protein